LDLVGAKLLKRNISDIAAMGGTPLFALVTVSASSNYERLEKIYRGLAKEAKIWKVSVCGGDFSGAPHKNTEIFSLSIIGEVDKKNVCLRANARPGDLLYSTGTFGNSYLSGHHLKFVPRLYEGIFLANGFTKAMMDVSDGLLLDLRRFCDASNVSLKLDTGKIPWRKGTKDLKSALTDGEDHELIFAVSPSLEKKLLKSWPFPKVKLGRLGVFEERNRKYIISDLKSGMNLLKEYKPGFEHRIG
jgi:thiamine-monophosphate kinase